MPVTYVHARPQTTVDVMLFTVPDFWLPGAQPRLEIALIERGDAPFAGMLALPGTVMRVEPDEDGRIDATDIDAARRVLRDKVGVDAPHLEQLRTWFTRDVDPRGATTVIAYFAVVPYRYFDGVRDKLRFVGVDDVPPLAFNHADMIASGVERVRGKAVYSSLPALLMPEAFTMPELQAMYEAVMARAFDRTNFGRKIETLGILEEIPGADPDAEAARARAPSGRGRPPRIYRLRSRELVTFERTQF